MTSPDKDKPDVAQPEADAPASDEAHKSSENTSAQGKGEGRTELTEESFSKKVKTSRTITGNQSVTKTEEIINSSKRTSVKDSPAGIKASKDFSNEIGITKDDLKKSNRYTKINTAVTVISIIVGVVSFAFALWCILS